MTITALIVPRAANSIPKTIVVRPKAENPLGPLCNADFPLIPRLSARARMYETSSDVGMPSMQATIDSSRSRMLGA